MKCPKCGFENDISSRYCGECGAELTKKFSDRNSLSHPMLVQVSEMGDMQNIPIISDKFVIGRSQSCDLVVPHASISRKHALIRKGIHGKYILEDLGSKNGVLVNGKRIIGSLVLSDGDMVHLGEVVFYFHLKQGEGNGSKTPNNLASKKSKWEMLLEISKVINSTLVLSDVLNKVMDAVVQVTTAQRGFLMIESSEGVLEFSVARNLEEETLQSGQFQISMSSVERVFKSGQPFISVDIDSDSRISNQQSIVNLGLKSVMCVPLKHKGHIMGVIYVDSHNVARGFTKDDLKLFEALADQAAIAIENARLVEENKEMFFSTIGALAEAIEKRDPCTGGHTKRVLEISLKIAEEMGVDDDVKENLKMSALLHDIGKIGIDDIILRKQGALNDKEMGMIKRHPEIGADIVKHIKKLQEVLPGILLHHEKLDGSGYPFGYKAEEIPFIARIVAVSDAFDAMVSDRPYRKGLSVEKAKKELIKNKKTQFDPVIVDTLIKVLDREGKK